MKEINKNIEVYNVNGICVGCLNYKRKMFQLEEDIECFKILGNFEVSDGVTLQVCWECLANIKNTMKFKEQINNSINVLLKYSKMHTSLNAPEDLSQFATQRLSIHKTTIHSHPNLEDENKINSGYIKIELELEEYVNEFDESGLDIKSEDRVHDDSNYQETDLSPDRVSSCDDVEPSNLQYSQMLTFSDEPEDTSRCKTQWLKKDKTIIHSYPNIKQELEEDVNKLDQSGLDIEVEVPAYEDSNCQNDHSSDSMSSDDDMQLSKLQSERNTWKRKLEDKKSKNIETDTNSKDKKIPRRLINLPSELGELYTITESKMAETSSADVASDQLSVTSQLFEPDPKKSKKRRRTNAQRQKEYRLRKKLKKQLDNNSGFAEVIPMQEAEPIRSSILKPKSAKRKLPDEIEQKRKILNQIRCRRYRERKKMRKKDLPDHQTSNNRIINEEALYFVNETD